MPRRSSFVRLSGPQKVPEDVALRTSRRQLQTTNVRMEGTTPPTIDRNTLLKIASIALDTDSVEIEHLPGQLYTTYILRSPSSTFCVLRCPSHPNVRLLRCESHRLATEAATLRLLARQKSLSAPVVLAESGNTASPSYTLTGPYHGKTMSESQSLHLSTRQYLGVLASLPPPTPPFFGLPTHPQPNWSLAFTTLLVSLLLDAEDSLLSLPYAAIHVQVRRHASSLAQITSSRLVLLDPPEGSYIAVRPESSQATFLFDYGSALWADALFSGHLCQQLSDVESANHGSGDIDLRVRGLLYVIFYSLLAIVRQCLRPSFGSEGNELEARRALTTALGTLGAL